MLLGVSGYGFSTADFRQKSSINYLTFSIFIIKVRRYCLYRFYDKIIFELNYEMI